MADKDKKRKALNNGVSNNYNYYADPGGAMTRAGYGRSAEKYRDRVRRGEPQSFPNKRRRIITGKDLTTPLRKARVIERHKQVKFATNVVIIEKEKLPWSSIIKIVAAGAAICVFILTFIFLFETDDGINSTARKIRAAHIETNVLERQFELENDSSEILRIAREDFGMVEERYIQKKFISSRSTDKAVVAEYNSFLPDRIAAFLARLRREE